MKEVREILSATETMNSLYNEAIKIRQSSEDYIVKDTRLAGLVMNNRGELQFAHEGNIITAPMSRFALGQFGTKVGVPAPYIEKCMDNGMTALAQMNVNAWLPNHKGGMMFRKTNDHFRGILSPRYSSYDSERILDVVSDKVDFSEYQVKNAYISEERLHIRLVQNDTLNIAGEDLFPALFIDSSDVGRNTLIITFGLYKFICSNGLVISKCGGTLYRQRHVGIDPEEFEYGIAAGLKEIPTLTANAETWVDKAINETMTFDAIKAHLKAMKLKEKDQDKVIDLMNTRYGGNTRWGFINGVTEVAQQYSLDKREELEEAAGRLIVA